MIHPMASKVLLQQVGTVSTSATASVSCAVDTWAYATVEVSVIAPTAATSAVTLTALAIEEADGTSYAAISGLTGTTNTTAATGEFVIPATSTSTPNTMVFGISMKGRKKNLRVKYQGVTGGATLNINVKGWQGERDPSTASNRGVLTAVSV